MAYETLGGMNVRANMSANGIRNAGGTTSSLGGMSASSIGMLGSSLAGGMGSIMDADAFGDKLDAQRDADIATAKSFVTSYELQQQQNKELLEDMNHLLGDKMSERGLDALKEASMLKVAAAETGTSGGTTDMASDEAYITESMDKANIISMSNQQKKGILASIETAKLGARHSIDSMLLGGGARISTSSPLAGIAGGLQGGLSSLNFMTDAEKAKLFGG